MDATKAMRQQHGRQARALVAPVLSGEVPCVAVTATIIAWLVEVTYSPSATTSRPSPMTRPCAPWTSLRRVAVSA